MQVNFAARYTPTEKQRLFHACPAKYKLYGGAMGGGKSRAGCAEAVQLSLDIPGNRGVIVRKHLTVLKRTTVVTFEQVCPPELIASFNRTDMEVKLINGSSILFIEADESKDQLFDKLKSLEIGWFFIDEASEVVEDAFRILCTRLRWKPATGHFYGMLASNPEDCWIKDRFVTEKRHNHAFIEALPFDNPHLPKTYVDELFEVLDEDQIKKYVYGSWDAPKNPNRIIPYAQLKQRLVSLDQMNVLLADAYDDVLREYMGIDVAEFGDDSNVSTHMRGPFLYEINERTEQMMVPEVSDWVKSLMESKKVKPEDIGIDANGVGAGVWGNLRKAGYAVRRMIAGERVDEHAINKMNTRKMFNFENRKTQWYWQFREDVLNPDSGLMVINDIKLVQELTTPEYSIKNEKTISIEPSATTKAKLKRSPDKASSAVICNAVRHGLRTGIDDNSGKKRFYEPKHKHVTEESIWA